MVHWFAVAMFVALFTIGEDYFRWGGNSLEIQTALFASFVFGVIASYSRKRGI